MQVFYAPDISGDTYTLDENESKHLVRVLRMKAGMQVRLIDGKGNLYEGLIENPDHKKCLIRITGTVNNFERRNYTLHIAISPLKNADRFEWFIEKSVEIGIDIITPLICHNSEKTLVKPGRIESIIVSAMKQSLKAVKPVLNEPVHFKDFIRLPLSGKAMIAHCNDQFQRGKIGDYYSKGSESTILIGPEGDFTPGEIGQAYETGYTGIHLGNSRLRSETAGVAACHSVYFINQ